jgi:hypothetical protein
LILAVEFRLLGKNCFGTLKVGILKISLIFYCP